MLNLIATLAVGTVISFIVFKLAVALYKKVRSPLLNPLLVTVAVIIVLLCVFHIPLDSYESSVQLVSFLLDRRRSPWRIRSTANARSSSSTSSPSSAAAW